MIHVSPGPARKRSRVSLAVPRCNGFAVHLYRACAVEAGDQVFSPFGVQAALIPAYEGARGRTREQMAEVLRLPPNGPAEVGELRSALLKDGNTERCRLTLDSALRYEPGDAGLRLALAGTTSLRTERSGKVSAVDDADLQGIELSLAGSLTMFLVLPRDPGGLPKVERSLSDERLEEWARRLRPCDFAVRLPKLVLERSYDLAPPMASMGMQDPFDAGHADFSGLVGARSPLFFGVVLKASVEIAGTAGDPGVEAVAAAPPFLFVIRHDPTGAIVFMGRVAEPR